MSEGMTATWIELEERDAKAITDRLQRDATNGDMAHNALADALIWNIEHNIASSKMIFAVPDTIIKKLKAENMCADGITIPLPDGKAIPLVIDGETVDSPPSKLRSLSGSRYSPRWASTRPTLHLSYRSRF